MLPGVGPGRCFAPARLCVRRKMGNTGASCKAGPRGAGCSASLHCSHMQPGWKEKKQLEEETPAELEETKSATGTKQQRSAWDRLIKKVYGIDPLRCPKCDSDMKIVPIIMNPEEIDKILRHLVKIGRAPPNWDFNFSN